MLTKANHTFRSPDAVFVVIVIASIVAISLAGALAPLQDSESALAEFMRANDKKYSQFNEELLIRHFFQDEQDGVFVDIGCAWPVRNSTTCYLERHLNWTGIAVDAIARHDKEWAAERPRSQFLNYAVSDQSGGTITFYEAAWSGVSSLSEEHATKFTGTKPTPIEVDAITLNDLLKNAGVESFDFLSLDIEGAELLALAGFDLERFSPRLVCVEGRFRENSNIVREHFAAHGYELIEEYKEYDKVNLYFRRQVR